MHFLSFLELVQETEIQVATKIPKPWDACAMLLRITLISKPSPKQTKPAYVYTGDRLWLPREQHALVDNQQREIELGNISLRVIWFNPLRHNKGIKGVFKGPGPASVCWKILKI